MNSPLFGTFPLDIYITFRMALYALLKLLSFEMIEACEFKANQQLLPDNLKFGFSIVLLMISMGLRSMYF
jgi:hypothetical protein